MRLIPTLYAERLEGKIRYRLETPERDAGAPLEQEFVQVIDAGTLSALLARRLTRCSVAASARSSPTRHASVEESSTGR